MQTFGISFQVSSDCSGVCFLFLASLVLLDSFSLVVVVVVVVLLLLLLLLLCLSSFLLDEPLLAAIFLSFLL